jgi:hypothetical protein
MCRSAPFRWLEADPDDGDASEMSETHYLPLLNPLHFLCLLCDDDPSLLSIIIVHHSHEMQQQAKR